MVTATHRSALRLYIQVTIALLHGAEGASGGGEMR